MPRWVQKYLPTFFKAFLDFFLIGLAFELSYLAQIILGSSSFHGAVLGFRLKIALVFALLFVVSAERLRQYEKRASLFNIQEKAGLLRAVFTTSIFFLALNGFFDFFDSLTDFLITIGFVLAVLSISRHFLFKYQHKKYLKGEHERKVLIYGAGETGQMLLKKMYFMEGGDYSLIGFIDDNMPPGTELTIQRTRSKARPFTATVLGGLSELPSLIQKQTIHQVIIAMPSISAEKIFPIIEFCVQNNIAYGFVPHLYNLRLEQVDTKNIGDVPLLKKREYHLSFLYKMAKRIFDIVFSVFLLLGTAPLFPFLALLVKLGSKGPVFFKQQRMGKDGKIFTMYKFRTMSTATPVYMSSPSNNKPSQYINRIGSFLRDTNLDELPQLCNVLTGEMSIVGPRPEMPFHVEKYDEVQRDRLKVKPGLTGLWQISPDRDKEIHEHIDYDLYYINHQSFFLDLVLVGETALLTLMAIWKKISHFSMFYLRSFFSLKPKQLFLPPDEKYSRR